MAICELMELNPTEVDLLTQAVNNNNKIVVIFINSAG